MEEEDRRAEGVALLVIVALATLSLASLFVAFSYYCYISNKVSKHLKSLGERPSRFPFLALPSIVVSHFCYWLSLLV